MSISLAYFIFSKIHSELPKVAQLVKMPNLVTLMTISCHTCFKIVDYD